MTNKQTIDAIKERCEWASKNGFKLALWPFEDGFCWQWKHSNGLSGWSGSTNAGTKEVALFFATLGIRDGI
jgi:hypothetical protein